jgi:hypothetical protein
MLLSCDGHLGSDGDGPDMRGIGVVRAGRGSGTVAFWFRLRSRRMSPADRESSYRAIERLIATYAELVDDGDFAAVGRLLADATFTGGAGAVSGGDAIEKVLRDIVIVYEPRGIALDASFGRVDDPIASGFGHFRASRPSG